MKRCRTLLFLALLTLSTLTVMLHPLSTPYAEANGGGKVGILTQAQ
jgi:hypothetical protein